MKVLSCYKTIIKNINHYLLVSKTYHLYNQDKFIHTYLVYLIRYNRIKYPVIIFILNTITLL